MPPLHTLLNARVAGTLAVNAIPIVGVLFWGWSAAALMVLYWLENVVIGAFNLLRMLAAGIGQGKAGVLAMAFLGPFFTFHYGLFCFVHGIFVQVLFVGGFGAAATISSDIEDMPRAMIAAGFTEPGLKWGLASMVIWQAAAFVFFFLFNGAFRKTDPMTQMMAPYGRIIVLHLTIMAGALLVLALGQPMMGVVVLAMVKTAFDVGGEARALGEAQEKSNAAWKEFKRAPGLGPANNDP